MLLRPLLALLVIPAALRAQATPYVALDDPRLPAFEHLIALGDIDDPSPMVRPFTRADAVRVLSAADSTGTARDTALVRHLLAAFADGSEKGRWRVDARAGAQGYSHARRDVLHPAGPGGVRPYVELDVEAVFGHLVIATRPAIEPRLVKDPDWTGRKNIDIAGRHAEAYLSAQFHWVSLYYGQMDQQWGPVGVPGLPLSNYAYPRPAIGFEVGPRSLRLSAVASQLRDETDTSGQIVKRYFFAHRLAARLSSKFSLALWETTVLAGVDRSFDGRFRNPVTLMLLANEYGLGDDGNVMLGLDLSWRLARRATLQAQLALDDLQYKNRTGPTRTPNRYAFTLQAFGPLVGRSAWRGLYTQASSLAFRTIDHFENLEDGGVGLGRNFADDDQLSLFVTTPVTPQWLLTPELTLLRQGEGKLSDPFPPPGTARGDTPTLFIGTVERTWRAALGLTGEQGPLRVSANAGFHHVINAGNISGRTVDRLECRLQATLGLGWRGSFK